MTKAALKDAFKLVVTASDRNRLQRTGLLLIAWLMFFLMPYLMLPGHAESLFATPAEGLHPYPTGPRMLFSSPRPQRIGDLITLNVKEVISRSNKTQLQLQKQSQLEDNTLSNLSDAVESVASNVGLGRFAQLFRLPSIGASTSRNQNQTQAVATQNMNLSETVTCEVVQVLPNGNLMIQGRKAIYLAKERTDVYITGIVNPFFLTTENTIESTKVANFQIMVGGKGMLSRSQNDGLTGRIFQFVQ
jgi:flagellar L-ring protein precursor FlgH